MASSLTPVDSFRDTMGCPEDRFDDAAVSPDSAAGSLPEKKLTTSWSEFAQDTTMHGVRYVNVADSPKAAR